MRFYKNMFGVTALLLLTGCATFNFGFGKTLEVTGETLDATGKTFVKVAGVYKQGCDVAVPRTIQQPQCAAFKTFGTHFQKSYPLAVQLWEAARSASDNDMKEDVEDIIVDLTSKLTEFAVQAAPKK